MGVPPQCVYAPHRRVILNWTLWPLCPLRLSATSMWYRGDDGTCRYYGFVFCRCEWKYLQLTLDRTEVHTIDGSFEFCASKSVMDVVHNARVVASAEFMHAWGFERMTCIFRVLGLMSPIVVTHRPFGGIAGHESHRIGVDSLDSELQVYSRRKSAKGALSGEPQICSASLSNANKSAFVRECADRFTRFPCGLLGKGTVAERLCVEPSEVCEFMWPACPPLPEETWPIINAILGWLQTYSIVEN